MSFFKFQNWILKRITKEKWLFQPIRTIFFYCINFDYVLLKNIEFVSKNMKKFKIKNTINKVKIQFRVSLLSCIFILLFQLKLNSIHKFYILTVSNLLRQLILSCLSKLNKITISQSHLFMYSWMQKNKIVTLKNVRNQTTFESSKY